jgi:Amt family ammonium transporter
LAAVAFYVRGTQASSFIGAGNFALHEFKDWQFFLFQWAFSAAAATIVSGSVAERCAFEAYLGYSFFLTAFAYPVVAHWVWDGQGWLSAFNSDPLFDIGMIDFAGSGVVHMVGGFAGLMGAFMCGPRMGRFNDKGEPNEIRGHSAVLVVMGTFFLWFGWYGFNPGSMLAIVGPNSQEVVGRSAVTTTLGAAAGGLGALLYSYQVNQVWDLIGVCNGILAGLVSVTAGCSVIEPWAAILAGAIGSMVITGASKLLLKLRIDDPLEACPMHGFCGAWGVLFVGLMAKKEYVMQAYGRDNAYGLFYGGGGDLLGCQIIGIIAIAAWTMTLLGAFFYALKVTNHLRIPAEEEHAGIDVSHHGGSAYNDMIAAQGTPAPVM